MPVNGLSVGKDVALDVITASGLFTFKIRTTFESRPRYAERESHGLDGINRHVPIPAGWEGRFEFDRGDNTADAYFAQQEQSYYNGAPILSATINETVTNPDGSVSVYQYVGVTLMLREGGSWKGDDIVKMSIDFRAQQRLQIM